MLNGINVLISHSLQSEDDKMMGEGDEETDHPDLNVETI